jgi:UrcA family protein
MGICGGRVLQALLTSSLCALWTARSVFGSPEIPRPDPNHPTQLVVKYADLDLRRHAGVIELYRRIDQAARAVCAPRSATPSAPTVPDACLRDAIARAVAEINEPALTRYFAIRMQQQRPPDPQFHQPKENPK